MDEVFDDSSCQVVKVVAVSKPDDGDDEDDVGQKDCEWDVVRCLEELLEAVELARDPLSSAVEEILTKKKVFCTLCIYTMKPAIVRLGGFCACALPYHGSG